MLTRFRDWIEHTDWDDDVDVTLSFLTAALMPFIVLLLGFIWAVAVEVFAK